MDVDDSFYGKFSSVFDKTAFNEMLHTDTIHL